MNKILSYIIIFSILLGVFSPSFALLKDACETETEYELYKCRIKNICDQYISGVKILYDTEKKEENKYIELEEGNTKFFEEAKVKYRNNMKAIYSCGLLKSQIIALKKIKKNIKNDKTGQVQDTIGQKIDDRINKLSLTEKTLDCSGIEKKEVQDKLTLLKQASNELCKYTSYLEYLREYNKNIKNIIPINNNANIQSLNVLPLAYSEGEMDEISINEVALIQRQNERDINKEIEHAFYIFPVAYHGYSEFENNILPHFLLEVIRESFVVFKNSLQPVLGPLVQSFYKAVNAMGY